MAIPSIHTPGKMVQMYDNTSTITRVGDGQQIGLNEVIHTDNVYNAMLNAAHSMEERLATCRRTCSSSSTTCSSGTSRSRR